MRAALLCAALAVATAAAAHEGGASYSQWRLGPQGGVVELRVPARELARVAPDAASPDALGGWAATHLRLLEGDVPCTLRDTPEVQSSAADWAVVTWVVECPPPGPPTTIDLAPLLDGTTGHVHLARVVARDGSVSEHALTAGASRLDVRPAATPDGAAAVPGFGRWVALGLTHVAGGWDHLAFLAGLVLLAGSVGEVAVLVSAFTLAHATTLALAALGAVRPDAAAVETLIGFSIALVGAEDGWLLAGGGRAVPIVATALPALLAVEALRRGLATAAIDAPAAAAGIAPAATAALALAPAALAGLALFTACHFALLARATRPARLRAAVALAFGLVHGFGFAGALGVLDLPPARLAGALLGFNLGVEAAQLAAVALVWPLLRAATRRLGDVVPEAGAATVCSLGVYWFAVRLLATIR